MKLKIMIGGGKKQMIELNINEVGRIMDELIYKNDIKLLISIPENSREINIQSNFFDTPATNLYIHLNALGKTFKDLLNTGMIDESKKEAFLDGMLQLVRNDILKTWETQDEP